jgi:hypothetical protein
MLRVMILQDMCQSFVSFHISQFLIVFWIFYSLMFKATMSFNIFLKFLFDDAYGPLNSTF